ncbi:MAG: ribosomal RNA small subunit methyltransferase A [Parachlamydiales bacterium]|nr:ribosomal RNA small subunit methyltransferase A [Parachlamydiales bacterium]
MPLYRPTEVQALLQQLNVVPKKRLSQNFLIDGNIVFKIVQSAKISPDDLILEIGPGLGVMTEAMCHRGAHIIAVEKDHQLIPHLRSLGNTITVYEGDFLQFPLESLQHYNKKMKVISNLPYHIAAPIIIKLLSFSYLFDSMSFIVQKEVAERMAAQPHTKTYSSFSIFVQYHATVHYLFDISPHCFFPRPRVTSSFIHLDIKNLSEDDHKEDFFLMVRTLFHQRRKQIVSILKKLYSEETIKEALRTLQLSLTARPEECSLEELRLLFQKIREKQP